MFDRVVSRATIWDQVWPAVFDRVGPRATIWDQVWPAVFDRVVHVPLYGTKCGRPCLTVFQPAVFDLGS